MRTTCGTKPVTFPQKWTSLMPTGLFGLAALRPSRNVLRAAHKAYLHPNVYTAFSSLSSTLPRCASPAQKDRRQFLFVKGWVGRERTATWPSSANSLPPEILIMNPSGHVAPKQPRRKMLTKLKAIPAPSNTHEPSIRLRSGPITYLCPTLSFVISKPTMFFRGNRGARPPRPLVRLFPARQSHRQRP